MAGNAGHEAGDAVAPADLPAKPATATPAETDARPDASAHSEWTISDRRGPVMAASDAKAARDAAAGPEAGTGDAGAAQAAETVGDPPAATTSLGDVPEDTPVAGGALGSTGNGSLPMPGSTEPLRAMPSETPGLAVPSDRPPRRSLWPVAAGVVLGALVGAGSAALVSARSLGGDADKLAALSARIDAVDKRGDPQPAIADLQRRLDGLAGRIATVEKRPAPAASASPAAASAAAPAGSDAGAIGTKLAALQADVDGLKKQDGGRDLAGKLDALGAAVAGMQASATTTRSGIDALTSRQQDLDGRLGTLRTDLGGVQKQATAAQSGIDAVRGEQKSLAGRVDAPALAVAADSLVRQVDAGKPYGQQLDALATMGADLAKLAVLRQNAAAGVSAAPALLAMFQPLADPVIATGSKLPADAGLGEKLKHGLFGLVSVHRAENTTGNDLPSRVALIRADLARGDVTGAYAAWAALPPEARAKSDAWGATAKSSADASAAARALQVQALGSLAAKRS